MTLLKDLSKSLQFVYIYIKIAHSLPVKKKKTIASNFILQISLAGNHQQYLMKIYLTKLDLIWLICYFGSWTQFLTLEIILSRFNESMTCNKSAKSCLNENQSMEDNFHRRFRG